MIFRVEVTNNLSREDNEVFLAHIIESGILNFNKEFIISKFPGIEPGSIKILQEKTLQPTRYCIAIQNGDKTRWLQNDMWVSYCGYCNEYETYNDALRKINEGYPQIPEGYSIPIIQETLKREKDGPLEL